MIMTTICEDPMIKSFATVTACVLPVIPVLAFAGEFVAIGHVTDITLLPDGAKSCPPPCPRQGNESHGGYRTVCISNECGCEEAHIQIDRVLLGSKSSSVVIKHRLGEWCKPVFPLTDLPVLVRMADGEQPEWSVLFHGSSGDDEFYGSNFTCVGSVDVFKFTRKQNGMASLSKLEARLRH